MDQEVLGLRRRHRWEEGFPFVWVEVYGGEGRVPTSVGGDHPGVVRSG